LSPSAVMALISGRMGDMGLIEEVGLSGNGSLGECCEEECDCRFNALKKV
jgi:hypothetical protein